MRIIRRLLLAPFLVLGMIASPAVQAVAQDPPALVFSVASPDRLLNDFRYLTQAAGLAEVGGLVTVMAETWLDGLDKKRPAGVLVAFQDTTPVNVAFLPVSDLAAVRKKLEERGVKIEDLEGGVKKLNVRRDLFMKEQAGWVFLSDKASHLAHLPQDPVRHLMGLELQHSVALRINASRIPPSLKERAASHLREALDRRLQREVDKAAARDRELAARLVGLRSERLQAAVQEFDQLTVGWGVDRQAGKTYLECEVRALAGTRLARQLASLQGAGSASAGFLFPEAAVTLQYSAAVSPEQDELLAGTLQVLRGRALARVDDDPGLPSPAPRETVKESLGMLVDVLQATSKKGHLDGGAAIVLSPGSVQVVAGGRVADGTKVEEAARKLVEVAKDRPNFPQVHFDAETYKGVDLHTLSVPVPDREKDARRLLGDRLDVVIGTGPERAYLAFGRECSGLLKKVIGRSAGGAQPAAEPVRLSVAMAPILALAASLENRPAVSMMAKAAEESRGKDHVLLTARPVERGAVYRLEIEEGVLRLIGQAARARGAAGGAR